MKKGVGEIITVSLITLLLFYFYSEVILHPNDYLFSNWGDGVKNYYTYLYHAKYDSSFWEFGGMNYPYYEHMVFTDGHPLLSYLVGLFGLSAYGVGILNILMMLAYPICGLFIYWILRHFKVDQLWAIAAAVGITFLAPQVWRMTGHFSLSYSFAIPGMWLILIKSEASKNWKWPLIGCLYALAFFFTHPYLGLILALFAFTYWLVNAIISKAWKINMIRLFVVALLPIILFQALVILTDTHVDRTGEPQGFYDYYARWNSLLVPHHGPMVGLRRMLHLKLSHWEMHAYVGVSTILIFLFTLGYSIAKRKELEWKKILLSKLGIFVISASLVLIFSFCFPFKFSFMHWVADLFGPLKQFRVLGRFAWVFFFVSTIASAVIFFRIGEKLQKKTLFSGIFVVLMTVHFFEGAGSHQDVAVSISQAKNPFKIENVESDLVEVIDYVNNADCDALIMLPFQHMSSENIMLLANEEANFDSFILSYHCNKPMVNSTSSRMSITEAIQVNNFFSPEYIEKELIYDFPEDDKIIIVKRNEHTKDGAMRLIFSSELLFRNNTYQVFAFDPSTYNSTFYFDQIVEREAQANVELAHGFRSDTSDLFFVYESYDDDKGEAFAGGGALHGEKEKLNVLYELGKDQGVPEGHYKVSYWYYLGVDAPTMQAVVDVDYSGDKESVWADFMDVKESTFIVDRWCRVELDFEWTNDTEKVTVFLNGNGKLTPYYIDEFMIYPVGPHGLFQRREERGQEYIIYNNDWIRADSFSK